MRRRLHLAPIFARKLAPAAEVFLQEAQRGTADAVAQNIDIIDSYGIKYAIILAGDHIYKMDYELMLQQHVNSGADVTIGCLVVPRMEATGFGVMAVDGQGLVVAFDEKPERPEPVPGRPEWSAITYMPPGLSAAFAARRPRSE